jgi:hypothetical protein
MLIVGALLCLSAVLTERYISLFPGIVLALVGVLSMINPAYVVEPHEVQVRNMLGMTLRRLPLRGPLDLRVDEKAVWFVPTGKRVMGNFGLDKAGIQQVGEFVASGQAAPGQAGTGQMGPGPAQFGQQPQAPQQQWNPQEPQQQPGQPQAPFGGPQQPQAPQQQAWDPRQGQPGQQPQAPQQQAWNPQQGQQGQPGRNPYSQ